MSVGGEVIETIDQPNLERVWINTRERYVGGAECAIYVERSDISRSISPGDHVWWEGPWAMWTPRGRPFVDRRLKRVGCSGVERPWFAVRA